MDDVWDEHDWEDFLRENDRRVDRFMALLTDFMARHPPPPEGAPPGDEAAWKARLEAFMRRHTGFDGSADDLPVWEDEAGGEPEDAAGEGWKAGLASFPEEQPVDELPVYQAARTLARHVLRWTEGIPTEAKDSGLVQFCSHVLEVPAKLGGGHAVGYERDVLGGNIAYVKRGLAAANDALDALQRIQGAPYMRPAAYRRLYEATYEVRNAVALHVLRLRERFERGTD